MGTTKAPIVTKEGVPMRYEKTIRRIKAEVMLGAPSAGCAGVGICRVMPAAETPGKCPSVKAGIGLTLDGHLQFTFLKSDLDEEMIRLHFRKGLFQVLEVYTLPDNIACQLQLDSRHIEPGIYAVWETPEHFVVEF